jgi:hypothetical protein
MPTITIPRADVTTEEVSEVLRNGLGPQYNVLPESAVNWNPVGKPRSGHPDTIVVGIGFSRVFRAAVRISRNSERTVLHVTPGGITVMPRLVNRVWIAEKVRRVLRAAPGLAEARPANG